MPNTFNTSSSYITAKKKKHVCMQIQLGFGGRIEACQSLIHQRGRNQFIDGRFALIWHIIN